MDINHKNSRIIYIRRLPTFAQSSRGEELNDYFAQAQKGYGSYLAPNSASPGTGLSSTEIDLLLPYVLNIPKEDRDFRKLVAAWYENLGIKIPAKIGNNAATEGLKLEIGLDADNSKPVAVDNLPINMFDYLRWRHALGHPWIAPSENDGRGNQLKQFYIYDPTVINQGLIDTNQESDEALTKYLAIKNNTRSVNMFLTLMGVKPNTIAKGQEFVELRKLVTKSPKKFLELYNDKNKEIKYTIEDMINNKILERVGERIITGDSGDAVGNNMKEAILYFTDTRYSKEVNYLKAKLNEVWKKNSTSFDTDEDLAPAPIEVASLAIPRKSASKKSSKEQEDTEPIFMPTINEEEVATVEGALGDLDE